MIIIISYKYSLLQT